MLQYDEYIFRKEQDMSEFREVILCKYGELVLKGANLSYFEGLLEKEMKERAKRHGHFHIYHSQSTLYIVPKDEECDLDGMLDSARRAIFDSESL